MICTQLIVKFVSNRNSQSVTLGDGPTTAKGMRVHQSGDMLYCDFMRDSNIVKRIAWPMNQVSEYVLEGVQPEPLFVRAGSGVILDTLPHKL